MYNLNSGDRLV